MSRICNLSRRDFLASTAHIGGGLVLGFHLPPRLARATGESPIGEVAINAWLRIASDESVTVIVDECDMGQGVHTALPVLVAEELDVEWQRVRVEMLTLDGPERQMSTSGSSSVRHAWEPLRKAGASARQMLVAAAAARWGVSQEECKAARGRVVHAATGRSAPYGTLAASAASMPVPRDVNLKPRSSYRLIGHSPPSLETRKKVDGEAIYGIDVKVPEMLTAAIRQSPAFGGEVEHFDREAAMSVSGVRRVLELPNAVIVIADRYWQAVKGLERLDLRFSTGDPELNSETIERRLREGLEAPAAPTLRVGDPDAALARAKERVEADYFVPFLAHATMEPMNCTVHCTAEECEVWAPTQNASGLRATVADLLGLPLERVRVHTTLMGGGFGRRVYDDFAVQAALASKAVQRPVKLIWNREEDLLHDFYRPAYAARLQAGIDERGKLTAWTHRVVGPPLAGQESPAWFKDFVELLHNKAGPGFLEDHLPDPLAARVPEWIRSGRDWLGVAGASIPYQVSNQRIDYVLRHVGVPVGIWRGVGHTQNAFFVESFVDELAHKLREDPYRFRRNLIASDSRARGVLDRAVRLSQWEQALPPGRGRGIALRSALDGYICVVAEVSLREGTKLRIERLVCAVDGGQIVHPNGFRAQIEGGLLFGLSDALHGAITLRDGGVEQHTFHDYRLLGMSEAPEVVVDIVESDARPAGAGEFSNPLVPPALTNAIAAAGGKRIRTLPLRPHFEST
jgi:CO/xanthine dehydrogenase Mo-binding subunit